MKSFRQLVLEAVLAGAATVDNVLAKVGNDVSAARAAVAARREQKKDRKRGRPMRRTVHASVSRGQRIAVTEALRRLCDGGKIRRVSRGVYGPPVPKLFQAG